MSEVGTDNGTTVDGKAIVQQFKLISVNFKEAALDSPSFRATINHLDTQLDNIEKWFAAISSSVKRLPKFVNELSVYSRSFLDHLIPPFIQDGLIDQEYTVQALKTLMASLRTSWELALSSLAVNTQQSTSLNIFLAQQMKNYREVRARFEQVQKKFDMYLDLYVSTPKTKEANSVMDDAYQLYQVKREYLRASLDLIIELTKIGNLLDEKLIGLSFLLLKSRKDRLSNDEGFNQHWYRIQRIQAWSSECKKANERLIPDVEFARRQVEESFDQSQFPSRALDDYKPSTINNKRLKEITDENTEKHGYLFMKTWLDKSQKPIWVRRWAFIKDGVFGMLVLSPSQTFVQESDKIGVMLCNVKYSPNEDRRFCFEIATVDVIITLQTESFLELKSWLRVFDNEKARVMASSSDDEELFNIASRRFPPALQEFASSVNTGMDRRLTSSKITEASGRSIVSSKLATHIESNERDFKDHIYFNVPQCRPPFTTANTRSSIIGYDLIAPSSSPSALTANVWGSVNWGLYYLHDIVSSSPKGNDYRSVALSLLRNSVKVRHPDYYPADLVPLDMLMRALFETAIGEDEYCLLSYRSTWSPNSRQELSGRCFVTQLNTYIYIQTLGFVALSKVHFDNVVSVDVTPLHDHDVMKIHFMEGSLKVKLFLDEGNLLKQKMSYLVDNRSSNNPKSLQETISHLLKIEHSYWENYNRKFDTSKSEVHEEKTSFQYSDSPSSRSFKVDYKDTSQTVHERVYKIPPKALFHTIFGSESHLLYDTLLFEPTNFVRQTWHADKDGKAKRHFFLTLSLGRKSQERFLVEQKIEQMADNEYYNVTHTLSEFQYPFGLSFTCSYRFVIIGLEGGKSKLSVYQSVHFSGRSMFNSFIRKVCKSCSFYSSSRLDKVLTSASLQIGKHGAVVKAVNIFGKIRYSDQVEEIKSRHVVKFKLTHLIHKLMMSAMLIVARSFVNFVHIVGASLAIFIKGLRMNWTLIILLLLSAFLNVSLIFRSGMSYWTVHEANKLADSLITVEPMRLQRAIYLKDVQEMLKTHSINNSHLVQNKNSICYGKFKNISFVSNLDRIPLFTADYGDEKTRNVAKGLRESFKEIGFKRHELLVQLRMLDKMEKDIAVSEWKNWLTSEINRCEYIQNNIFSEVSKQNLTESVDMGIHKVIEFCDDCAYSWSHLDII